MDVLNLFKNFIVYWNKAGVAVTERRTAARWRKIA
jgi:hypothetical protein